jgi:hypothetical protein
MLVLCIVCNAQERALSSQDSLPVSDEQISRCLTGIDKKAFVTGVRLDKATSKYLSKLLKQENKLKNKIRKKDSTLAKQLFTGMEEKYSLVKAAPQKVSKAASVYSGHLDSLSTALRFFNTTNLTANPKLQKTLSQLSSLQDKLNSAEGCRKFIKERGRQLEENLEKLGMLKEFKGFQKHAYYYGAQLREYKATWEDPAKLEKKLMEVVMKLPKFKEFFRHNSMLGYLFALSGGEGSNSTALLAGLQSRASIQQTLIQQFGSGSNVQLLLQQNVQAAQGHLSKLKNKIGHYSTGGFGNSNSDIDLPQGFKSNSQKTKTFLQRLEYGVNIQSQKARSYFPVTSDIGLSLGYRLNDNSAVGIGTSYKLGLGRGWNNIRISSEGVGLRTYVDHKLNGSLYISGGYEQNFRTAFSSVQQLKDYYAWQSSGLIGLSKKYRVSKKLKGDMKLLWDFLSSQQVPRTQPLLFRVGYSLK